MGKIHRGHWDGKEGRWVYKCGSKGGKIKISPGQELDCPKCIKQESLANCCLRALKKEGK